MGFETKIAWTDATFNPWRGCQRVSEGCTNCYAETLSKRNPATLGVWGPKETGTRVVAAEAAWRDVAKWNRKAGLALSSWEHGIEAIYKRDESRAIADGFLKPHRPRVFCASLADVFEDWHGPMTSAKGERLFSYIDHNASALDGSVGTTMADIRQCLFDLIATCTNLDFLLLTKRPENVLRMTYDAWCIPVPGHVSQNAGDGRAWKWPSNAWMGTTVENRDAAWKRLPELLKIPARVRFVSAEPLLEDISEVIAPFLCSAAGHTDADIDQVIVGGESGPHARPFDLAWARSIRDVCRESGTAFFMKQTGSNAYQTHYHIDPARSSPIPFAFETKHPKGEDPAEWPADLRIQHFPEVAR